MDEPGQDGFLKALLRVLLLLFFLYMFLLSIELLGASFKMMGRGFAENLLRATANPLLGLFMGILATTIVQSSSVTTSIIVGMVAGGTLTIRHAVPIVMGANIGTTVTNTIVSIGHITHPPEMRRAFAAATVHDFFNFLSVLTLLPIEMATHYLEHSAIFMQTVFSGVGGLKLISPLKVIVKPLVHIIIDAIKSIQIGNTASAIVALVVALAFLFTALSRLVVLMKGLVIGKIERLIHGYLFSNPVRSFLLGLVFTAIIQSSSVVTSLIVPIVGAGILTLEQVFPYTIGANVGTTVTAIMASLVTQNPAAISTAFVHLLFNISGGLVWYCVPILRKLPLMIAKKMGGIVSRKRWFAFVYVVVIFYILPLLLAGVVKGR